VISASALPPKKISKLRGHLWFIRRYGWRAWRDYEQDRRAGVVIDYAKIFSPDELAVLEEHGLSMWGKRIDADR
jgi:hypothetical protein